MATSRQMRQNCDLSAASIRNKEDDPAKQLLKRDYILGIGQFATIRELRLTLCRVRAEHTFHLAARRWK